MPITNFSALKSIAVAIEPTYTSDHLISVSGRMRKIIANNTAITAVVNSAWRNAGGDDKIYSAYFETADRAALIRRETSIRNPTISTRPKLKNLWRRIDIAPDFVGAFACQILFSAS
jgi:hypothetical protein